MRTSAGFRLLQIAQQSAAGFAAADHRRAPLKAAGAREFGDKAGKADADDGEEKAAQREPRRHPYAREGLVRLEEEHRGENREEKHGPSAEQAKDCAERMAES